MKPESNDEIPEQATEEAMTQFAQIVKESMAMNNGQGSRIGYFAALYHGVTKSMIGPIKFIPGLKTDDPDMRPFFDDAQRLDRFVWIFAKRYFDAYRDRDTLEENHPWKRHFDYCDDPKSTILQILASGANAHMVLDLPMAAIRVSRTEREPLEDLRGDFNRINQVLSWQISECQQQVLDKSPTMRLVNRVPRASAWIVNKLIGRARELAWFNANTVAPDPEHLDGAPGSAVSDAETEEELRQAVGGWAQLIARPPLPIHLALRYLVAPFEKAPINEVTRHLLAAEIDDDDLNELRNPGWDRRAVR